MSEWFDQYMQRLSSISAAGGRPNEPAVDITARILNSGAPAASVPPKAKPRGPFRLGFTNNTSFINKTIVKPGAVLLDNLARGNYAMANPFTQAASQGKDVSFDIFSDGPKTTVGEDIRAAWRGFTLQDKNTFGDALREEGYGEGFGRAAGGFALDVVSDPINLIPASLIAKAGRGIGKGASAVGKATGLSTPPVVSGRVDEVTNLVDAPPGTTPTPAPSPEAAPSSTALPEAPSPTAEAATPAPVAPEIPDDAGKRFIAEMLARVDEEDAIKAAAARGEEYVPPVPSNQGAMFDLKAFRDQSLIETLNRGLSQVPTVRTAPKYFRDVEVGKEPILKEITEEVIEEVPEVGGDASEVLTRTLIERQTRDSPNVNLLMPKGYQGPASTVRKSPNGVETVAKVDIEKWVNKGNSATEKARRRKAADAAFRNSVDRATAKAQQSGFSAGHKLPIVRADGEPAYMGFGDFIDDVASGEKFDNAVKVIDEATGETVGLDDFVTDLRSRIKPTGVKQKAKPVIKKVPTGEYRTITQRQKLDDTEREIWKMMMEQRGFSQSEINQLLRNANLRNGEKAYDALLQRILATPYYQSFSLDEFIDGVRSGQISDTTPEVMKMYRSLGVDLEKYKTPKARIRRFEQVTASLRKRVEKTPLTDSPQERGLLFDLTRGEAKAKKAKVSKRAQKHVDRVPNNPDGPWAQAQIDAALTPSAEDIVDEAATVHGDDAVAEVLNSTKVTVDPRAVPAVEKTMGEINISEFRNRRPGELFGERTNRGAQRTSREPGKGFARWPAMNSRSQYTMGRYLLKNLRESRAFDGLSQVEQADLFIDSLKAAEETLKSRMIAPTINEGSRGIPLGVSDILRTMGPEWVAKHYLNVNTGIPPTHLNAIVEGLIDGAVKGGATESQMRAFIHTFVEKGLPKKGGGTRESGSWKAAKNSGNPNKYIDDIFVKPLMEKTDEFVRLAEETRAAMHLRNGQMTKQLTDEVMDNFHRAVNSGEVGQSIRQMAELRKGIAAAAKDAEVSHVQGLGRLVEDETMAQLGDRGASLSSAARAADEMGNAKSAGEKKALVGKVVDDANKQLDQIEVTDEVWDIAQKLQWRMDANILRRLAPHLGNKHLRPVLIGQRNFAIQNSARFTRTLSELTKKYATKDINAAFHQIRISGVGENPSELTNTVNKLVKQFLDPQNPKYDALHRNGMLVHELNRQFDHFGVDKRYRFKDSLDEWVGWDIEDPMDFLAKAHTSAQQIMAYQNVGHDFSKTFGSSSKKPGWVKITSHDMRKSILFNYLDESKYYPREIAQELTVMDEFLVEMSKPANRHKVLKAYDTAFYAFKAGYTIYRPGHHLRNALGDAWLSYMDGVWNPKYYDRAVHLLATGRAKYTDFEFNKALADGTLPDSNKIVATVNGQKISAARAYQMMYQKGALPDHSILEDIRFDTYIGGVESDIPAEAARTAGERLGNRLRKPFGGKLREQVVRVSEVRDHYFRAAHFLHAMENIKPPKGLHGDEAIDWIAEKAAQRTRKFHPDGSDLTKFEHGVMRRGVTFYSWARKALPLVIELMVLQPGRFMVYPKAMMNAAQGMGIDLEGYGDPFPQDQLFPSFMRDSTQGPVMGETGNYWGVKTGIPGMDIIDDFLYSGKNLGDTLAQSTTPFARVPAEVLAGSKLGTQVPIQDMSDYIGGQIPNVGYADKVSNELIGRTVSSGFTDDLRVATSNEGYTPDMPGPVGKAGLINWLLGMGFTDMSKPSYIKTAEREIGEGR